MIKNINKEKLLIKIKKSLETWNPITLKTKIWRELSSYIDYFVDNGDESFANELACYRVIFRIQASFLYIYYLLKNKEYDKAWYLIEDTTKDIELIKGTNEFKNQWAEEFHINEIYNFIHSLEQLYPYSLFISRDVLIKQQVCSICGQVRKIKNGCGHRVGKLYYGRFCKSIWTDYEVRSYALVKNSKDKYTFITPEGSKYNFGLLNWLVNTVRNPYIPFSIENGKVYLPNYIKNVKPMPQITSCWLPGFEPHRNSEGNFICPENLVLRYKDMGKDNTTEREEILLEFLQHKQ